MGYNKKVIVFLKTSVIAILVFLSNQVKAQEPRYIFLNSAPGRTFTVAKPSTFNRKFFDDVVKKVNASPNNKMKLGISVLFDF